VLEFVESVCCVASGGTAFDPEVVAELLNPGRSRTGFESLTPREREVLAVWPRSAPTPPSPRLVIAEKSVSNRSNFIFSKLDLPPSDEDHRRVFAVPHTPRSRPLDLLVP